MYCSSLPPSPPNQPTTIPWGGTVMLDRTPVFRKGRHCLGRNNPEGVYDNAPTCPQIGIRAHRFA